VGFDDDDDDDYISAVAVAVALALLRGICGDNTLLMIPLTRRLDLRGLGLVIESRCRC
jgi:hypothetical protein